MSAASSYQYAGAFGSPAKPRQPSISTGEHQQLAEANRRVKKILRAARIAAFNGYVFGFFATASLLYATVTLLLGTLSIAALMMGVGLIVFSYNEFYGARMIRQLDTAGPRRLGWNQLAIAAMMITYFVWSINCGLQSADDGLRKVQSMAGGQIELNAMMQDQFGSSLKELYTYAVLGTYAVFIACAILFQGGNALYYFTRRRHIQKYLDETPSWIVDVQRTGILS